MNKRTIALMTAAALVIIAALAITLAVTLQRVEEHPPVSSAASGDAVSRMADPITVPTEANYRLGVWEGKLAVFLGESLAPDEVYDVDITSLPETEQQRLQEGIACDAPTLERLLEDYTS